MALNPLLSLIGRLVVRSGRKRGNRQTDRQTDRQNDKTKTTITLAAHARRGLITILLQFPHSLSLHIHVHVHIIIMKGTKVQTLGARAVAGAWCMAGCLGHNCTLTQIPDLELTTYDSVVRSVIPSIVPTTGLGPWGRGEWWKCSAAIMPDPRLVPTSASELEQG